MLSAFEKMMCDYPDLDLESCRILLQILHTPGYSIRELADILVLDQRRTQLKIALMANGRRKRRSSARKLITMDYNLGDPRKRSLALTDAGERLANILQTAANAAERDKA